MYEAKTPAHGTENCMGMSQNRAFVTEIVKKINILNIQQCPINYKVDRQYAYFGVLLISYFYITINYVIVNYI